MLGERRGGENKLYKFEELFRFLSWRLISGPFYPARLSDRCLDVRLTIFLQIEASGTKEEEEKQKKRETREIRAQKGYRSKQCQNEEERRVTRMRKAV